MKKHQPKILIEILDDIEIEDAQRKVHDFLFNLGYKKHFISDEGQLSESPICLHRKNYLFVV